MTKILGLDPGISTGWGLIQVHEDRHLSVLEFGITKDSTLLEILSMFESADILALEVWKTRPKDARKGSFDWDPMITPQVEGAAKVLAAQQNLTVALQIPAIKPVGYGFLRQKYVKGKKGMHAWDALAHAAFYAVKNLNSKPLGL